MNLAGLGGIAGGALALIVLETVTSSQDVTGLASFLQAPAWLANDWMNPDVPLIPNRASSRSSGSSGSGSLSAAQQTAAKTAANQGRPIPGSVQSRF